MILAKLGCGFDASGSLFVSCNVAECNGSGQADSEATDSMPQLWDSFSVHDAVQQGRVLDLSIQLSKLRCVFLSYVMLFLHCFRQQQDFCGYSALMTNCCRAVTTLQIIVSIVYMLVLEYFKYLEIESISVRTATLVSTEPPCPGQQHFDLK